MWVLLLPDPPVLGLHCAVLYLMFLRRQGGEDVFSLVHVVMIHTMVQDRKHHCHAKNAVIE